ncbi:MAG: STAS domain-containing protein [Actinoplanes sp.]
MARFDVTTTEEPGQIRVTVAGECDLAVSGRLSEVLTDAVGRSPVVVVDLAGLAFLDSSGMHGLVIAHRAARERGGRLVAVGATGNVATVLELTGVGALLRPQPADHADQGPG